MSELVEYELPNYCFKRLTQNDNSDEFTLIFNFENNLKEKIFIRTTQNKARVISNKVNEMLQIDPTITSYEIKLSNHFIQTNQQEERATIENDIEILIKTSFDCVNISTEQKVRLEKLRFLLGEKDNKINELIQFSSINEAISYIFTDIHDFSIEYLANHMKDIIDGEQIFQLNDELINEIIDTYFSQKFEQKRKSETETETKLKTKTEESENDEEKEIFEKLSERSSSSIVMHFVLQCEISKCTKDMREYIINHLSDDIVLKEMSHIIRQFLKQLNEKDDEVTGRKSFAEHKGEHKVEYNGEELKGIISHLEEKYGTNLCEQGELKISDIGTHQHSDGSLLNLIKYDQSHINEYYMNNYGNDPLPDSSNGWIEFDFFKRKINLTSYTLRTSGNGQNGYYHAKSWRIVGSNDRNNWDVINQQVNNSSLNGKYRQHRFECDKNDKYYRYIRYIQDDSWSSGRSHNIWLTCVEFFGSIEMNDE